MSRNNKEVVDKNELPVSQAEPHIKEKKYKKAIAVARFRPLKNFLFWLLGVLSSIGIVLGSVFIGLKVVPMSTYVGKDNLDGVVSENVADDSLIDFVLNFGSYEFGDFPIVEQTLNEALEGKDLGILSEYQAVETPKLVETTVGGELRFTVEEGVDATKYYCESEPTGFTTMSAQAEKTFVPAFDSNGYLIDSLTDKIKNEQSIQLYYQPLTSLPIMQALSSMGEYIQFVPVSDLLSIAGMGEGTIFNDLFKGVMVGDFMKTPEEGGFSFSTLLNTLTLDALGGTEILGAFGNFSFFKSFEQVLEMPEVVDDVITKDGEEFTSNPKLYYVLVTDGGADGEDVYARAFTDEGEFITKYYVDEDGKVYHQAKGSETPVLAFNSFDDVDQSQLRYANLSKTSFADTFELLGISFGRQSIGGLLDGIGLDLGEDSLVNELFGDVTIQDLTKSPEEGGFDINTIKLHKLLGDVSENQELYDLLCSLVAGDVKPQPEELTIGHLLSDFNFEGIVVADFISLDQDTLELLCSAINPAKKAEYVIENDPATYVEVTPSNLTIGDFKYFKQDDIKISTILGDYQSNKDLYDVILSAKGLMPERAEGETENDYTARVKAVAENLEISSLSNLQTDDIYLTIVLPVEGNEELYDILLSSLTITDKDGQEIENPTASDIRIVHFKAFKTTSIKLGSILDLPTAQDNTNEAIYKILSQAIGGKAYDQIIIGDLSSFKTNNIKLCSVLELPTPAEPNKNKAIYDILTQAIGVSAEEITIGNLVTFDIHNVKLSAVLNPDEDEDLYKVLAEIYPNKDVVNELTIADLSNFDVSEVRLGTVFPQSTNPEIYKVFGDALNLDGIEGITQADKLAKVSLKEIEERLDISHIHLATVLEWQEGTSTGNELLDALLKDDVTVGDISDAINHMSLYEIYGENCFVYKPSATGYKFKKTEQAGKVTYTLSATGDWVINTDCGMWLLWCFDVPEGCVDEESGMATKYVASDLTMDSLQSGGSIISSKIIGSTIRQLAMAGIIDDSGFTSTEIYKLTITDVLERLDQLLSAGQGA